MVKMTRAASVTALVGLALGIATLVASPARAIGTSDQAASILYWPKVVYDGTTDTLIRLSNVDTSAPTQAHCYYIDANSHCSNNPTQICDPQRNECGAGSCVPGWMEIDFDVVLTFEQPLAWNASRGIRRAELPLVPGKPPLLGGACNETGFPCGFSYPGCTCNFGQTNVGTGVPPVPEVPFVGALECIQYAPPQGSTPARPDNQAGAKNKLIGQATFLATPGGLPVDAASYNATGLRFRGVEAGVPGNELRLDDVQYDSCPTVLVLDHLFDNAIIGGGNVTDLTLVPCGNNFAAQIPGSVTAQFLVFNEFEQRFSTTRAVPCFLESQLSLLDTTNPTRSIFSFQVAGTWAGQTRIRPVGTADTGRGLTGAAWMRTNIGSAAYNLHQNGNPAFVNGLRPDIITLP
ncbi:MAG: hypothetical protein H6Q33_3339 [Deltaproteobacteria bacterium]|nr:hypothetical protein [Deltaproteobacteria bacterium]